MYLTDVSAEGRGPSIEFSSMAQTLLSVALDDFVLEERVDGVHFEMTKRLPVLELR